MALQATRSSIFCRSEVISGPTARTDVSWTWTDGKELVTLCVLELKNTQLLRKADYDQGLADMGADTNSTKHPKNMIQKAWSESAPNTKENPCLGQSTSGVARQAKNYHKTGKTDYVAVFDWCSMIIFGFGGMDEGRDKLAKGTWYQERPGASPNATFRMLLYGMLIASMKRTGVHLLPRSGA